MDIYGILIQNSKLKFSNELKVGCWRTLCIQPLGAYLVYADSLSYKGWRTKSTETSCLRKGERQQYYGAKVKKTYRVKKS
jgi:hypothetical protein